MSRAPSMPAPISKDEVEVVLRKRSAPKGPPPNGMSGAFRPKSINDNNDGNPNYGRPVDNNLTPPSYYRDRDRDRDKDRDRDLDYDSDEDRDMDRDRDRGVSRTSSRPTYNNCDDDSLEVNDSDGDRGYRSNISRSRGEEGTDSDVGYPDYSRQAGYNPTDNMSEYSDREADSKQRSEGRSRAVGGLRTGIAGGREHKGDQAGTTTAPRAASAPFSSSGGIEYTAETMPVWSHSNMCRLFNFEPLLKATYKELKTFVTSPSDAGTITRCYIERNRQGLNRLAPVYSLCADLEDGTGRELIVCRKIVQCASAYYVFSLKHDDLYQGRDDRSRLYIGKLRAITGGSYVLFDSGVAGDPASADAKDLPPPADPILRAYNSISREINEQGGASASADAKAAGSSNPNMTPDGPLRKEMAVIHFNNFKRPLDKDSGIRGLELCIGKVDPLKVLGKFSDKNTPHLTLSAEAERSLAEKRRNSNVKLYAPFRDIRAQGRQNELRKDLFMVLHERNSRYDPLSSCLVDFHGRANLASVKNFQLIMSTPESASRDDKGTGGGSPRDPNLFDNEEANRFILQLGKSTGDCFNMDYKHPLSMFQAFAICIARFDANLTFNK